MPTPPSAQRKMAPHLQNAMFVLWIFFLLWSVLALFVLPFNIGASQVKAWLGTPATSGLAHTAEFLLAQFDFVWVLLAALSTYFALITTEGLRAARRAAGIVLAGTTLLLISAHGSHLGGPAPLLFSAKLGYKLAGRLPLGAPLLGLALFFSARNLLLHSARWRAAQKRTPLLFATSVALLSGLVAWNIAPIAFHQRFYAIWLGHRSAEALAATAWALAAFVLALLTRSTQPERPSARLSILFCLLNAPFLLANIVRWIQV